MQIIEGSGRYPEIIIDADNSFIALRGICAPESGARVFLPVMAFVEEMINDKQSINMAFNLKYFNSISAHYLLKIFVKIAQRLQDGDAKIEWKFDPDDEDNKIKGEYFAELSGLEFDFVEL